VCIWCLEKIQTLNPKSGMITRSLRCSYTNPKPKIRYDYKVPERLRDAIVKAMVKTRRKHPFRSGTRV
jgi:hypothetical protein